MSHVNLMKCYSKGPFDIYRKGSLEENREGPCFFNLSRREGTLF